MAAASHIRIHLVPATLEEFPDLLERILEAFTEHLTLDRGIEAGEAKRQAAEILDQEVSKSRAHRQDVMSIRDNERQVGALWKTARRVDEAVIWHLLYIEILPAFRGRGFARAAMTELIELAGKAGISKITLNVSARNIPALALYRQLGFRPQNGGMSLPLGTGRN